MKKTIILTLILTMLALPAMGESIDLSTIGFSDLIELRDNVEIELKTRPEYEEKGYAGLLIGGKNIAVGAYALTCVGDTTISIWVSESSYGTRTKPNSESEHADGESVMVNFDNETHVLVEKGTVVIQLATQDWVPKTE